MKEAPFTVTILSEKSGPCSCSVDGSRQAPVTAKLPEQSPPGAYEAKTLEHPEDVKINHSVTWRKALLCLRAGVEDAVVTFLHSRRAAVGTGW